MPYVPPPEPGEFTLPMRPERLTWCLDVLGWTRGELARRLCISETTAAQMTKGTRNIPHRVAVWIDTLTRIMLALPEPIFWSDGEGIGRARHPGGFGPDVDAAEAAWNAPKIR